MSNGVTNVDSVTKCHDYIERAKELGMSALAFSEHGSVFDWHGKKESIEKAGMKYIHAAEFYVTEKIEIDDDGHPIKLRDNWHCLLIAKNFNGVKEINRLSSKSFNRKDGHYYYAPRIEFMDLINTSDNVIISTACLGGILNRASDEIQKQFIDFMIKNKDRCFLEIQHHNVTDQKVYNQKLYNLSKKYGLQLVACTDTHSLNEEHADGRRILQLSKNIRFDDEDGWDLTFKSYDELCDAYEKQSSLPKEVYLGAIENTNKIANMVETFEVDRHTKYPHIYDDPDKAFKDKINKAYKNHPYLKTRYPSSQVVKQIREEYDVYKKVGAIDFMLLEAYLREWERENGIQCGYGRGSVSGSLIAYVLGITQMDSVKFNLNFFRFMNPGRVTNADIDTDYCSVDREKIKYFLLHDKMNLPHIKTSEIITFNTIATKGAIKDVCRALDISLDEAQQISDAVNTDGTIDDKWKERYPDVFKYVDIVSGTIVSIGSHPSGVLVSDKEIEADVGLCSLSTSDYPVSMLDMHGLDDQMYVKLDILGLDNIGVINECCKLVGIDRLTPDNVNLEDEAVWRSIRDDTTMIFQWESDSAAAYLKKFMSDTVVAKAKERSKNFSYIKWFSFGNGLLRPACASYRDEVADGIFYDNGFKELNDFLAPEAGRVCMQETIMQFLVKFCGYSNAESDNVRRGIAKKKGTEQLLPEIERRFIEYSSTHYNITKERCQEVIKPFLQIILDASSYGFSWNHSDAYSCIGYVCGFLRHYYPLEFLTAAFNTFTGKEDKIVAITKYANKVGIKIQPPKFRYSRSGYQMSKETNSIYKGLESIKFLNAEASDQLYAMRDMHFDSFIDFLNVSPLNSRQLDILVKLDFFSEFGKAQKLIKIIELYNDLHGKKQIKKDKTSLPIEVLSQYAISETAKMYKFDDEYMDAMLSDLCSRIPDTDIPLQTKLQIQQEMLGYISYVDVSRPNSAVVMDIDCKYSPKTILYLVGSGHTISAKIAKKAYQNNPFSVGDILNYRSEQRPKWKKVNDEWVQDASAGYDTWLTHYTIEQ
jgi:DNA polymerase-3 subunit alpha